MVMVGPNDLSNLMNEIMNLIAVIVSTATVIRQD